jgi:hypothetical protein
MPFHEDFRKRLARFERSGGLCRSNDCPSVGRKAIDDANAERQLRTYDGEIDRLARRDIQERAGVRYFSVHASRVRRDTGVSRGADHVVHGAFAGQSPYERMFAGAAANNEDSHAFEG